MNISFSHEVVVVFIKLFKLFLNNVYEVLKKETMNFKDEFYRALSNKFL